MKKVILRGPVLTQSGYGVHTRQVARWLLEKEKKGEIELKIHTLMWGDTPWILDSTRYNGFIKDLMERTTSPKLDKIVYDVSFQLQLPNEWDPKLAKFNVGITAGIETDRCNPEWIACLNSMNLIIVPSQHVRDSFLNTGKVSVPIVIVPEAYSDEYVKAKDELPKLDTFPTNFNFLVFGQITGTNPYNDRKNIFFTVKWLCELFKDDPDVGIVLKTNTARGTKIDRQGVTHVIKQLLSEVRPGPNPKVYLFHGNMSEDEVAALYNHPQITSLISLTRGEGYGLPILEAATCGLPIIATNWSGHLDFLKRGKFIKVQYKLEDIHKSRIDNKIFMQGARWAEPEENDFKSRVTKFRTSNEIPREWARDLQTKIRENYSYDKIALAYNLVTKDII